MAQKVGSLFELYQSFNWHHAETIIKYDFPEHWASIVRHLSEFRIEEESIASKNNNGEKTDACMMLEKAFRTDGWKERCLDVMADDHSLQKTFSIDAVRGKVVLEIEWYNEATCFDRDLVTFRKLFDQGRIDVAVIVTRSDQFTKRFQQIRQAAAWGFHSGSASRMGMLIPKIRLGYGGGCPILALGVPVETMTRNGVEKKKSRVLFG